MIPYSGPYVFASLMRVTQQVFTVGHCPTPQVPTSHSLALSRPLDCPPMTPWLTVTAVDTCIYDFIMPLRSSGLSFWAASAHILLVFWKSICLHRCIQCREILDWQLSSVEKSRIDGSVKGQYASLAMKEYSTILRIKVSPPDSVGVLALCRGIQLAYFKPKQKSNFCLW